MKKKKIWAIIICIVLFVLASLSVLFLVLNGKSKTAGGKGTETQANTDENTEVLLSFDSYEEITKAGLKIGNQFGETKINTEAAFITEGKGSWMIRPQGDYGKEGYYPYFRLRCTESSFAKSDFDSYDKLLLDIYNDSDEVIEMECILSATNAFDSYDSGETVTWTLKPNAWTACEYDLSGEEYNTALDLTEARYMNVTILSMKESKEDTVPTLYLDNLRGHISEETRERGEFACNFREPVTFETVSERYLFNAGTVGSNKVSLSRAAYKNSVIGAQDEEFGEYGLQGTVQGATWPATTMRYNEELPAGTIISCKVYVAADEAEFGNATYYIEPSGCSVFNGRLKFNCWETVEFELKKAADSTWFFLNFDNGEGSSMFGTTTVTYFMDNFRILSKPEADFTEGVDLEDPLQRFLFNSVSLVKYEESSIGRQSGTFGTYGLTRDLTNMTWPSFGVNFGATYKKGDRASFMVYVEADEKMTSEPYYYMGSWDVDIMNGKLEFNEWNQIEVVFKKDTEKASIFVNLDDGNEKNKLGDSKATAYLDNFVVVEQATVRKNNDFGKGVDFEDSKSLSQYLFTYSERVKYSDTTLGIQGKEYGEYGLKRDGTGITWPSFYIDLCKEYPEGDVLTFMLYVEADETLAAGKHYYVGAYGHDVNNDKKEFNRWVEVQVPLKKAADTIGMFLNFDNGNQKSMFGDTKVTAYLDNFKVIDTSEVNKKNDFSMGVTFEDRDALAEYLFTSTGLVKYADTSLGKQSDTYGEYGIMRDGTKITWPSFYIDFCKEYEADDILSFMLYVDVDETLAEGKYFYIDAYGGHNVSDNRKEFNKWVQVNVPLKAAADKIGMFLNFDDGNEKPMFGEAKVVAYMDNFRIIKTEQISKNTNFEAGVTFEGEGMASQYLFANADFVKYADTALGQQDEEFGTNGLTFDATGKNWPGFTVLDLRKTYPAGSRLCFRIYAQTDEALAKDLCFWVDNDDGTKHPFNQWTEGWVKVSGNSRYIFLNFEKALQTLGQGKITVYLDNFYITEGNFEEGITLENRAEKYMFSKKNVTYSLEQLDGNMVMKFDSTNIKFPYVNVNFNKKYTGNAARLCFKIYVKVDEALVKDQVFYVGADDGQKHPFNQWTEGWVKVTNTDSKSIYLNFDKAISAVIKSAPITVYLDDFYVTEGKAENTLSFENPAEKYVFWKNNVTYTFEEFGAAGTAMKFVVNQKWPRFNMQISSAYTEKKKLFFRIYAKVDEALLKDEKYYVGNDDPNAHSFNQWEEGYITIGANSNSASIFLNFEKALKTIGKDNITVYLDDFVIK